MSLQVFSRSLQAYSKFSVSLLQVSALLEFPVSAGMLHVSTVLLKDVLVSFSHLGYDCRESEGGHQSHKKACRDLKEACRGLEEACRDFRMAFRDYEQVNYNLEQAC